MTNGSGKSERRGGWGIGVFPSVLEAIHIPAAPYILGVLVVWCSQVRLGPYWGWKLRFRRTHKSYLLVSYVVPCSLSHLYSYELAVPLVFVTFYWLRLSLYKCKCMYKIVQGRSPNFQTLCPYTGADAYKDGPEIWVACPLFLFCRPSYFSPNNWSPVQFCPKNF